MPRDTAPPLRDLIDAATLAPEGPLVQALAEQARLSAADRATIAAAGADLVRAIRRETHPGLMEVFLAEYGLSTDEGIALMCLAEALLRVPDAETIDALIEDKIAPSDWGRHLGQSASPLVNASTWALLLTGRVLDDRRAGLAGALRGAVRRLGEPVIRTAVARAMREMGRQFVLGETIESAMRRAAGMEAKGFTYSYDMLGEAARSDADARAYHLSYSRAIGAIAKACTHGSVAENPGISVKLSALHPRYEVAQKARVMAELVPRVTALAQLARSAGMGFNIDAEEADRLSLSLDVVEAVLADPSLKGWDGFGVVVQAYGKRAGLVIDWLHALATRLDRRIMVRLVKGAYWDAEVKRAQVEGLEDFPVFTAKHATDISYIANARKLLGLTDRLYPQFATHNAHTVAAVLHMARDMGAGPQDYEFQRLHGMGETLHSLVLRAEGTRCLIYAPVGAHEDLLAYLVRRLLENGANSSFVNQIVDESVPPEVVAADPFTPAHPPRALPAGPGLYAPARRNSAGWDLTDAPTLARIEAGRARFGGHLWQARPTLDTVPAKTTEIRSPATGVLVGHVTEATPADVTAAFKAARPWEAPVTARAGILEKAADLYESNAPELFALLAREAGKTLPDAVAELREAVDFLRYYAAEARSAGDAPPRGTWACISPWNFPLAIFTGQIAAALATGNAVLAKPAGQTPLIAARAVALLHQAGVPETALALLPGGPETGATLTALPGLAGVAFTGSTATAQRIRASLAEHAAPGTPLIAETGGLNAMIVDSTALPEHAVRDIVNGAFRSAGQRCSALRCLYVQEDVAEKLLRLLKGAMEELTLGDPWHLATDVGPVIDAPARDTIRAHVEAARAEGHILHELSAPEDGTFIAPVAIRIPGIAALEREVFGPVLHVATFAAADLDRVIAAINATGYGLTFGLHTRIDDRVQQIVDRIHAGNIYVNRNQIGAVVGSQPFGGEGLSGTGPKAGGPNYLPRFLKPEPAPTAIDHEASAPESADTLATRLGAAQATRRATTPRDLPGPTGESNRLTLVPRGPVLCLGPGKAAAAEQARAVEALGGIAVETRGPIAPGHLTGLSPLSAVLWWG
ncbi:MAG: bifunctional proline dehydrogenase/L-glutamate gamma-semialdehyde dehydrogenase PutA, partial [Rubellimicrobium sp.]|nr:bifunctional proline dehydrogenase/L-glutamate gamma-semialdehyde dehydrogenase PutA [Rubellimicrobium sp.]